MRVKFGAIFAVCVLLGLFAGSATACINGKNSFKCFYGAKIVPYYVPYFGRCARLRNPLPVHRCAGCTIAVRVGYIDLISYNYTYRCNYGSGGRTKACEAYCLDRYGNIAHGYYECYVHRLYSISCSCRRACSRNN
eukprot:g6372.t1